MQQNAPAASGVYGISNSREWIYIGETDNIKASLMRHLIETGTALSQSAPTGFSFELSLSHNRASRRESLVRSLLGPARRSNRG